LKNFALQQQKNPQARGRVKPHGKTGVIEVLQQSERFGEKAVNLGKEAK
jgi:hypothetical protein